MSFKLKLFDSAIWQKLCNNITVRRIPMGDYKQYILAEYSQSRLTHDNFDNHYYRDPSFITAVDVVRLSEEKSTKSRSR